ncbi:MAG: glutathione S-transferase family protein [Myxococcales bacterium]|nr:glutathione S-transferase family protein [Myxococcales bacterium]
MSEVIVYGPPLAPFTEKVRRALMLKKLEHRIVEPESPEDYRRWNPETGLLPVADIDGVRVPDSVRILDVLDERYPEPPLVSSDGKAAEQQRSLETWAEETFFFYWERYLQHLVPGDGPGPLARFGILRRSVPRGPDRYAEEFAQRIDDLANFLGGRPFFYGERISRADLAVYSFVRNLREGIAQRPETTIDRHPSLIEWFERVEQETSGTA